MAESSLPKYVEQINRRPWREHYGVHPACEVFPPLSPEELKALSADIKRYGVRREIVLRKKSGPPSGYEVVDGRSRLDALQLAGLPLFSADGSGSTFRAHVLDDDEDPYEAAISANILRRHLTAEQRRDAIAKVLALRPEQSDRQIAKSFKVDHKTVGAVRKKREVTGEVSPVDRTVGADGKSRPVKRNPAASHGLAALQRLRSILFRANPSIRGAQLAELPPDRRAALLATLSPSQRTQWQAEMTAALPVSDSPVEAKPEAEEITQTRDEHLDRPATQIKAEQAKADRVEQRMVENDTMIRGIFEKFAAFIIEDPRGCATELVNKIGIDQAETYVGKLQAAIRAAKEAEPAG